MSETKDEGTPYTFDAGNAELDEVKNELRDWQHAAAASFFAIEAACEDSPSPSPSSPPLGVSDAMYDLVDQYRDACWASERNGRATDSGYDETRAALLTAIAALEAKRDDYRRQLDGTLADYARYVKEVHDQDEILLAHPDTGDTAALEVRERSDLYELHELLIEYGRKRDIWLKKANGPDFGIPSERAMDRARHDVYGYLDRAVQAAVQAEREACAAIADEERRPQSDDLYDGGWDDAARTIAESIRDLSTPSVDTP